MSPGNLQRLAVTDPVKLAQIAYGLLPRDVFISVEQRTPGNLDPDEWAILRRVIDLIQVNASGAELGPVLTSRTHCGLIRRRAARRSSQSSERPLPAARTRSADLIQRGADGVVARNAE